MNTFIEEKVKLFYDDDWILVEWIVVKNPLEDVPTNASGFRPRDILIHTSYWDVRDYKAKMFLRPYIWDVIAKRMCNGEEIIEIRRHWEWLTEKNLADVSYIFLLV